MHAAREMDRHNEAKSRFAREHDPCKRLHDVRKSRLGNMKKPAERNLVLTARQVWYSEYIHIQECEFCGEFGQGGELRYTPFILPPRRFIFVLRKEHAGRSP
jgi:hypothetical protein